MKKISRLLIVSVSFFALTQSVFAVGENSAEQTSCEAVSDSQHAVKSASSSSSTVGESTSEAGSL